MNKTIFLFGNGKLPILILKKIKTENFDSFIIEIGDSQLPKKSVNLSNINLGKILTILKKLKKNGFNADDITDVFLTHLHFDHCGGGVVKTPEGSLETTFKNAKYRSNKNYWDWATDPNKRESASFLKERTRRTC